jgi:plastocyanin
LVAADQVPEGAEVAPTQADEGTPDQATPAPASAEPGGTPAAISASEAATGDTGAADAVTIEAVDIDWNPNEVTIPANTDVPVTVPNNGAALHTFVIEAAGFKIELAPGETGQLVINAQPGTYEFICDVPGHAEAGMVGTIIVQ